ncbi:C-terminal binding protein [Salinibacterium sp. PAMC 21357]|uniref:C-terminal binding protein n=1 Tax=Salinibacterium sp. PAMC 21357 TaxID=1112215 RepID=UPI000288DAC6|nr:C-terminal binding protein [Salinibacterium sp. PAMC 21357]
MSTRNNDVLRAVYTDLDGTDFSAGRELLSSAGFEVSYLDSLDAETIVAGADGASALLVGYAEITRSMIERMPSVKIIALMSMGFNHIDVDAATEHGIWVTTIVGAATEEVATHALAMALHLTRGITFSQQAVVFDRWNERDTLVQPRLSELTLGLMGLGRIGMKFAELARPLFGEIIGYDPFIPDTDETREHFAEAGVRRVDADAVRSQSDVLSLHLPLTNDTANMVDADFLSTMKPLSYLINVSRGGLVDSAALRASLDNSHLAGAGLDVLDVEPATAEHPLLGHPRALITPHIAYFSGRSEAEYVRLQAQNVVSWASTGTPDTPLVSLSAPSTSTH